MATLGELIQHVTDYGNRCDLCGELHPADAVIAVWADGDAMQFCAACVELCKDDIEIAQLAPGEYHPRWLYKQGLLTTSEYEAEMPKYQERAETLQRMADNYRGW